MERVFCENCGRQRRAVEAVGAYEGTPYCEPCRKADDIPEQDFVRFGGQRVASDAGSRSQDASGDAAARLGTAVTPESLLLDAKRRCVDCGARIKLHGKREPRLQCRDCEKKSQKVIRISPKRLSAEVRAFMKLPASAKELDLPEIIQKSPNKKLVRTILGKPKPALNLLSDSDYQKLKPHNDDLTRQLLAQIGMIVAVRGPKQGRLKLDAKKGDNSRNLAGRIRRVLRKHHITAEVESFMAASCVVVSVGYGKQAK